MAELTDIRETVRQNATPRPPRRRDRGEFEQARTIESESGCCGSKSYCCSPADETGVFGASAL